MALRESSAILAEHIDVDWPAFASSSLLCVLSVVCDPSGSGVLCCVCVCACGSVDGKL
jgi:hypothetical protein